MKKLFLVSLIFSGITVFPSRVAAQSPSICNTRCDVNEDCGKGYRCYVGVCRALACPASSTCICSQNATQVSASAKPTLPPIVTTKKVASSSAAPIRVATQSVNLKSTPKTGSSSLVIFVLSLGLFGAGFTLSNSPLFRSLSAERIWFDRSLKKKHLR